MATGQSTPNDRLRFPEIGPQAYEHPTDRAARVALRKVRGFETLLRRVFGALPERRLRLLFFRLAGITVEVTASLDEEPDPDSTDQLWGIAYKVEDVGAAQARLSELGEFDVSEVRSGQKPGTRVSTVRANTCGVATLLIGPED